MNTSPIIVLDFETNGLSPQYGGRAIEIGAVLIEGGRVIDRFQNLMNPGCRISPFIEAYTGITNEMVAAAPPCEEVMEQFAEFIGDLPLVAHNVSFDRSFLDSELGFINRSRTNRMACSMLAARRVFPDAPNHRLATLVRYCGIKTDGVFHRALADAEMTGGLWLAMLEAIRSAYGIDHLPFEALCGLCRTPKAKVGAYFAKIAAARKM